MVEGKEDKLDVIVELGRQSVDRADRMKRIEAWLAARYDVQNWEKGNEFDIWDDRDALGMRKP